MIQTDREDAIRRAMLKALYTAMYGDAPPAMPISPAELWECCLTVIRQTDFDPVTWRGWAQEEGK